MKALNRIEMRQELVNLGNGAHALAIQILGNADDAADAVHDAFERALSRPRAYDRRKGPLKPWFLQVVRNRCIDLLRQRRPNECPVDELPDAGNRPEQEFEDRERDRALQRALAEIGSEQRQIVVLRDYLDLSYAEIAGVLGVAQGTVMSRLHRARLALKEVLERYDG
jgi:RNA polymerase sigma-70 factor (ECF subfamily)